MAVFRSLLCSSFLNLFKPKTISVPLLYSKIAFDSNSSADGYPDKTSNEIGVSTVSTPSELYIPVCDKHKVEEYNIIIIDRTNYFI